MVSKIIAVIISMLPFIELRGGIPLAIASGLSPLDAFVLCTIANIIIIIPLFLFLDFLHFEFLRWKWYKRISDKVMKRIRKKSLEVQKKMKTWEFVALSLFVAIPLPMTGAWTGTLIAWFLKLNKIKSFIAIAAGVIIAGIIVTAVSIGLINGVSWAAATISPL